jgi:beta-glucosidase
MNANHITMPKHCVADGEPWAGVIGEGFEISQPTLREIHMPPFQAAVKLARRGAIMLSHHASDCTAMEVDYVRIYRKKP